MEKRKVARIVLIAPTAHYHPPSLICYMFYIKMLPCTLKKILNCAMHSLGTLTTNLFKSFVHPKWCMHFLISMSPISHMWLHGSTTVKLFPLKLLIGPHPFCLLLKGRSPRRRFKNRSSNGGEFISHAFHTFCSQWDIACQFFGRNSPQQNGVVERKNRAVQEMVWVNTIFPQLLGWHCPHDCLYHQPLSY